MKLLKKNFLLSIAICLAMLLSSFAGMFLTTRLKANDLANDYTLSVEKVSKVDQNKDYDENLTYYEYNEILKTYTKAIVSETDYQNKKPSLYVVLETLQNNKNDNVFMLNNANLEDTSKKEYLLVSFIPKNDNVRFLNLSVNATLTNQNDTYNISSLEKTTSSQEGLKYVQLFDLTNTYILDTSKDDGLGEKFNEYDAQGLYTFTFRYNIESAGVVTTNLTAETSFYLLNEKFYVNYGDTSRNHNYNNMKESVDGVDIDIKTSIFTEPRLFNTERIDRSYFEEDNSTPTEQNYFNFTNQFTTDYFGESTNSEVLLYPTLKFDAAKYNLTYTKQIYGVQTTFSTMLNKSGAYPKLVVTETDSQGNILSTKEISNIAMHTYQIGEKEYEQFIVTIEFDEIGKYLLDFHYVLHDEVLQAQSGNLNVEKENWNIVGTDQLTIFGYQLEHSEYKNENGATEKEMKHFDYVEISDASDFNRYNTYEYDAENDIHFSTLDDNYIEEKTYYKRVYITADVTNLNIADNSILGQVINSDDGSIALTPELENYQIEQSELADKLGLNLETLATTNQAPLFFAYLAQLPTNSTNNNFYYHFTKSGTTYTLNGDKKNLTSNSRFTDAGLYVVVLTYTHPDYQYLNDSTLIVSNEGKNARKVQAFVFEITSSEPEIKMLPQNSDNSWGSNGYTNQDVKIDWSNSLKSPFDVNPYVRVFHENNYLKQENDDANLVEITNILNATDNYNFGNITLAANGRYYVRVDYGPCTYNNVTNDYDYSASVTYTFVIDKEEIDDITFYAINNYISELSKNITNDAFAIAYGNVREIINNDVIGKKNSGAKISVTYSFMPINSYSDEIFDHPLDNEFNYIANNTSITVKNDNVTYNQGKIDENLKKTASNVLTNDGIYVFTFVDEAGNTTKRYMIKDTTSPVILQKVNEEYSIIPKSSSNKDNIVNTETEIIWGTHKAILLGNELNSILSDLQTQYNIQNIDEKNYLCIENNDVTITYTNEHGNKVTQYSENIDNSSYTLENKPENEHLYTINLTDINGNNFIGKLEMNFDNSLLMAHMSGTPSQNRQIIDKSEKFELSGDGTIERLHNDRVSNKKVLNISWLAGEGDFEVQSVMAYFYPLTFELYDSNGELNLNYPYSSNIYQSFNLMENTTTETSDGKTRTKSANINLMQDARFGELATVQGMYKVVRTYSNISNTIPEEYVTKEYYFYIDRNNLISYDESFNLSNNYIGNYISLTIGDNQNKYEFSGKDFLQEFVTKYILQSNKQPVELVVPEYKYYIENLTVNELNELVYNGRIGINRLNYLIYDNQYNSYKKDEMSGPATDYTIKIYDNSSTNFDEYKIENLSDDNFNSLQFVFSVNLYAPVANFVDGETGVILAPSNENSHISVNNTNVKLVWDDIDENDYLAKIDDENITIKMIMENGSETTINTNIQNLVNRENDICYVDLNEFADIINENCRLEITLKYKTSNDDFYGIYSTSTKIIYFDFEKPQTNYNNLKNNDKLLSGLLDQNNGDFDDYNSTINFENYAFAIKNDGSDWKLQNSDLDKNFWQKDILNATTNPNDVLRVWYRVYDKYADESGVNAQSIVPGDDRYDDTNLAPTRFRFNANLRINDALVYTQITSALEDFNIAQFEGNYVEIIEMDCAENYRIYTIYVQEQNSATITYNESIGQNNEQEIIIETSKILNSDNPKIDINNKTLQISEINYLGSWFMIDVLDGTNNQKLTETINVSPIMNDEFILYDDALNIVNSLIYNDDTTGKFYIIKITSPIYGVLTVNYRTPGQAFDIDFDIRSGSMTVVINQDKYDRITYLKSLYIYEYNTETEDWGDPLSEDSAGKPILKDEYYDYDGIITYTFTYSTSNNKNLKFVYTDNFGQTYTINQLLGVTQTPFESMLSFSNNYIQNDDFSATTFEDYTIYKSAEYYTNSNSVTLEYQPKIFSVSKILRDDIDYTDSAKNRETQITYRMTTQLSLFDLNDINEADTVYKILLKDTSDRYYLIIVHHYLKIAELKFMDSNNYNHIFDENNTSEYESSISRIVYLQYEEYDSSVIYPIHTTVTVTRTYYDTNNVRLTYDYGVVPNEFIFNEYGYYIITAKNSLGTTKIYRFELVKSDATYYSVKANVNGKTVFLSPSPLKYEYRGIQIGNLHNYDQIDHYLSIYDITVDVNQERNLKVEEITSGSDVSTRIYHIVSNDISYSRYEKYIAVTKISNTSNVLNGAMYLNETNITGSNRYLRTNDESVTLKIPAYFENEANLLNVSVIYNSTDLGVVSKFDGSTDINLTFKSAGIYYIYISDIAGNRHSFGGTAYYTLSLTNNFVYNLNNERGIYNSIFNESVSLSVLQADSFVKDGNGNSYTISATLNGNPYTPTYSKGNYIFNSYGTYFVTLRGYINEIDDANLVETEIKFIILNPNEAKLMHEYIGLNGYEVTKIEKNGTDITDSIRKAIGSETITKFALYGGPDGIGGNGTYTITVSALIDDIVGEKEFSYSVWINNDDDILILSSLAEGDSTTKNIILSMNLYQIYSKIGECKVKLNGNDYITINGDTAANNAISTYTLSANNRYNVTLETNSGNTILSFVVTKIEPLNTIAIIIIVVVSLVVVGLAVTFILLRKRMRVRW